MGSVGEDEFVHLLSIENESARNPDLARSMLERLEGSAEATECVTAAVEAQRKVKAAGYNQCPEWRAVWDGQRPEQTTEAEPGE